jgi:hypothetical protein
MAKYKALIIVSLFFICAENIFCAYPNSIHPPVGVPQDLGTSALPWNNAYISGTVYIGGVGISSTGVSDTTKLDKSSATVSYLHAGLPLYHIVVDSANYATNGGSGGSSTSTFDSSMVYKPTSTITMSYLYNSSSNAVFNAYEGDMSSLRYVSTPGDNDKHYFKLLNSSGTIKAYAYIAGGITTNTDAIEQGYFKIITLDNGTEVQKFRIEKDTTTIFSILSVSTITSSGYIQAKIFYGNGSQLTGVIPDQSAAYKWTGTHKFYGELISSSPVANVKAYGAKGDGATNDETAIQNAINSGRPVYIPKGNYKVKTDTIKTGLNHAPIYGDGWSETILIAEGTGAVITVGLDSGGPMQGMLQGFKIDGNGTAGYGIFVATSGAIQWTFRDLWIESVLGTPGYGFYNQYYAYSMNLDRLKIDYNNVGLYLQEQIQNTIISNSLIYDNFQNQVIVGNGIGGVSQVTFDNDEIERGGDTTGDVTNILLRRAQSIHFKNCYMEADVTNASNLITISGESIVSLNGCYANGNSTSTYPIILTDDSSLVMVSVNDSLIHGFTSNAIFNSRTFANKTLSEKNIVLTGGSTINNVYTGNSTIGETSDSYALIKGSITAGDTVFNP